MKKHLFCFILIYILSIKFVFSQSVTLWGLTNSGGKHNSDSGTLFKFVTDSNYYSDEFNFNMNTGFGPEGNLIKVGNLLYGLNYLGGINHYGGTLFSYSPATNVCTALHNFNDSTGRSPEGSPLLANNGLLYGLTNLGGNNNEGVLFSFDPNGNTYNVLVNFDSINGRWPSGNLIQASNGLLYGMTVNGGINDGGVIFSFNSSTNTFSVLHSFNNAGGIGPLGSLIEAKNGMLYGMTYSGGANDEGVLFSYDTLTNTYTDVHDFIDSTGISPGGSLMQTKNGLLYGTTSRGGRLGSGHGVVFSFNTTGNVYNDICDLGNISCIGVYNYPFNDLIQASNGLLYGIMEVGGTSSGTIYSLDTDGNILNCIFDFIDSTGVAPYGDLLEDDSTTGTGINHLSASNNQLSIYPNPTSGQFTMKLNGNQNGYTVEIYNVVGEMVYYSVLSNSQNIINLSSQPEGMYFVYLKSDDGVEVGKVMLTK